MMIGKALVMCAALLAQPDANKPKEPELRPPVIEIYVELMELYCQARYQADAQDCAETFDPSTASYTYCFQQAYQRYINCMFNLGWEAHNGL